jgi:hypothetical protein
MNMWFAGMTGGGELFRPLKLSHSYVNCTIINRGWVGGALLGGLDAPTNEGPIERVHGQPKDAPRTHALVRHQSSRGPGSKGRGILLGVQAHWPVENVAATDSRAYLLKGAGVLDGRGRKRMPDPHLNTSIYVK